MLGKQDSARFVPPLFTVSITFGRLEKLSIIDEIEADMASRSLTGSTVKASEVTLKVEFVCSPLPSPKSISISLFFPFPLILLINMEPESNTPLNRVRLKEKNGSFHSNPQIRS